MFQDECYYWQWSRHLDLSYVDQGPGIAYFIKFGTLLFGDTPLGVRLSSVLVAAGTGWLTFLTARRWFDGSAALWTLYLLACAPLLAAGGFMATYDIPQVFFWAAALYALTRALQDDRPIFWYALGALTGFGILCKVTMLALAPGVLLLLFWNPAYRKHLKTPHPYLAFALALVAFTPILIWNLAHAQLGFKHALGLGSHTRGTLLSRVFGDFLGGQALALGPLLWIFELWALARLWKSRESGAGSKFVLALTLPFLLICLAAAAKNKLEANWPAPMHLAALIPSGQWLSQLWTRRKYFPVVALISTSALLTIFGLFPDAFFRLGVRLSAKTGVKLSENYGWYEIARAVQSVRDRETARGPEPFVAGTNYKVESVLAFHLPGQPPVAGLFLGTRRDQYYVWTDPKSLVGKSAVLCLESGPDEAEQLRLARQVFTSVGPPERVNVMRPGVIGTVKQWDIFVCHELKGYDPDIHANGY